MFYIAFLSGLGTYNRFVDRVYKFLKPDFHLFVSIIKAIQCTNKQNLYFIKNNCITSFLRAQSIIRRLVAKF